MASIFDDIRRHKRIRAAEGYLDLLVVFADRWHPTVAHRDRLATHALETLAGFSEEDRHFGYVQFLRGQAFRTMERFREAIRHLTEAAAHDPENIHIQLALGWCFKRVGRIDLAIRALEEAEDTAPEEGIVQYNLACYWALAGNKKMAIQYLCHSFDLDPDYREMVSGEPDFDDIRNDPEFQMLTSQLA